MAGLPCHTANGCDRLALHQEGVGLQHRAVAHRHAVVHEGVDPDHGAGTDRGVVGLEAAVLQRVALDHAARVEHRVVADGDQRLLRDVAAVVEHPATDPHTQQPPDARCVNGVPAQGHRRRPASRAARAARSTGRRSTRTAGRSAPEARARRARRSTAKPDVEQQVATAPAARPVDPEAVVQVEPPAEQATSRRPTWNQRTRQEHQHRCGRLCRILRRSRCGSTRPGRCRWSNSRSRPTAARDLEARRAEQADVLPHRAVDRHHDLRAQQDVVADPGIGRAGRCCCR